MNNYYNTYSSSYYAGAPIFGPGYNTYDPYNYYQYPYGSNIQSFNQMSISNQYGNQIPLTDYGPAPFQLISRTQQSKTLTSELPYGPVTICS